jgi:hypothetical protein
MLFNTHHGVIPGEILRIEKPVPLSRVNCSLDRESSEIFKAWLEICNTTFRSLICYRFVLIRLA